jgi:hypothetical protein
MAPEQLPAPTGRPDLLSAIRTGAAADVLPPVVAVAADGLVRIQRRLSGADDAGLVVDSTLLEVFDQLTAGCHKLQAEYSDLIGPRILDPFNGQLFGPLINSVFLACLAGEETVRRIDPPRRVTAYLHFLKLFLERLRIDTADAWFTDRGARLPLSGLTAHDAETHNGGQRVLRVDFPGDVRLAYKPRPADIDRLFLAPSGSVFALLNAAGPIHLPVLDSLPRDGYSWHEWIESPAQTATIRRSTAAELSGTQLTAAEAQPFWHRAGSLTAACFGFGITDLSEGNLVTGRRPGTTEPMFYPIDLELALLPVRRLSETGLVPGEAAPHHHVGLETEPRWCAAEGPSICLVEPEPGRLQVWRRTRPWARDETRNVVADSAGQTGYAAYLTDFLRGMFDAWAVICTNQPKLRELLEEPATVRVVLRPTSEYAELLDDLLWAGRPLPDELDLTEREQLLAFDVPYYYRSTAGGPVLCWDPVEERAVETALGTDPVLRGDRFTLARLGVAVRDAVVPVAGQFVGQTIVSDDTAIQVTDIETGAVSFDWEQADRRVTYRWAGPKLSLQLKALGEIREIRERLLRLDAVDGPWRTRWTDSGFQDEQSHAKLRRLTEAGSVWLDKVIAEHGWPGRFLVGADAAEAACRLVLHLEGRVHFQERCLALLTEAAATGDVPGKQVAFLTDAIRVATARPQVFGTKFEAVDGELMPYPIEDPTAVDRVRAELGLEPLAEYTTRIRQRFALPTSEVS